MPCDNCYCATCHNLNLSLTIIISNGDEYFNKEIIFRSKKFHSAKCQILMIGWNLITLAWHYGYNCIGVAYWLKMSCFNKIAIKLQWITPYLLWVIMPVAKHFFSHNAKILCNHLISILKFFLNFLFDFWVMLLWIQFMKNLFNIGLVEVQKHNFHKSYILIQ